MIRWRLVTAEGILVRELAAHAPSPELAERYAVTWGGELVVWEVIGVDAGRRIAIADATDEDPVGAIRALYLRVSLEPCTGCGQRCDSQLDGLEAHGGLPWAECDGCFRSRIEAAQVAVLAQDFPPDSPAR